MTYGYDLDANLCSEGATSIPSMHMTISPVHKVPYSGKGGGLVGLIQCPITQEASKCFGGCVSRDTIYLRSSIGCHFFSLSSVPNHAGQ